MSRPEWLTAAEVAARLRTDPITIVRACRDGKIAATKPGKCWLISEEAVDAYLASGSNQAGDAA